MENKPTPTIEDYLGIIYTLGRDNQEIYGARLAELMNVSAPTVTVTLQRMVRDGWINMNPSKKISLTSKGVNAARAVIRRHMLTEWMLAKILKIPWSEVHEEAHRMEHTISGEVEESLSKTLQAPESCPHGNPMPGSEAESASWIPLSTCALDEEVIIKRIHEFLEDDLETLQYLEANNIMPGTIAFIKDKKKKKITIRVSTTGKLVNLYYDTASNIFVALKNGFSGEK
ncbi:metal-dependent transcriptional regulator [bacterium]|nr:MAG: metal-dependent transcriptional regulator [bacterium]